MYDSWNDSYEVYDESTYGDPKSAPPSPAAHTRSTSARRLGEGRSTARRHAAALGSNPARLHVIGAQNADGGAAHDRDAAEHVQQGLQQQESQQQDKLGGGAAASEPTGTGLLTALLSKLTNMVTSASGDMSVAPAVSASATTVTTTTTTTTTTLVEADGTSQVLASTRTVTTRTQQRAAAAVGSGASVGHLSGKVSPFEGHEDAATEELQMMNSDGALSDAMQQQQQQQQYAPEETQSKGLQDGEEEELTLPATMVCSAF